MPEAPTGTVTFLFTDIQGSTRKWEKDADAMREALKQHDVLMRQGIAEHNGFVFKTVGDAFCAAFSNAPDALAAAVALQHTLYAATWPESIAPVRVRMSIHTGAADSRDGDYFGPPLNRVNRLMGAGHGGQILLSTATAELVRDRLPQGVTLRDMGPRRLRDLIRPENIYQAVIPGLQDEFPPLKTLDIRTMNLPVQPTALIGREGELAAIKALLAKYRLVTLTGPGGTGKTRLSLQVAADLVEQYPDGVFFVRLDAIRDPALVIDTIANTLGVKENPGEALADTLKGYLREKRILLVLDNFEQIVEAGPDITDLLRVAPLLSLLVTSREVLRVYGEREFPVPPLGVPDVSKGEPLANLSQYDAVRLFVQRAQAVRHSFQLTEENAPAVAHICARLDGLPLAIELAAARVRLFSPEVLLKRLGDRLGTLTGGSRDLPARQQTLHGAIGWSYDLLDGGEKCLFARLGIFAGGWTIEAAEAVCNPANGAGDCPQVDVLGGLESLLGKSLIRQDTGPDGAPRFWMLATIRDYALDRLGASGEIDAVRQRHADYVLAHVETLTGSIYRADAPEIVLQQLEIEHDNLRAALAWALDHGEAERVMHMVEGLEDFWHERAHYTEGLQWIEAALHLGQDAAPDARIKAYVGLAWLAGRQGDTARALQAAEQAAGVADTLDLSPADPDTARQHKFMRAATLRAVAVASSALGDLDRAWDVHHQALALFREIEWTGSVASELNNLGEIARTRGEDEAALPLYEECHHLYTSHGRADQSPALCGLGFVRLHQGDHAQAQRLFKQLLDAGRRSESRPRVCFALLGFAALHTAANHPRRAAGLFGVVHTLLAALEIHLDPADQAEYDRYTAQAREQLGAAEYNAAFERGQAMDEESAVTLALAEDEDAD